MQLSPADYRALRDRVILETFGGPNTYRLLKERNPQIDMLLNAGIHAGARFAESAGALRDPADWRAETWRVYDASEA